MYRFTTAFLLIALGARFALAETGAEVDFDRQVRPLLSEHCFTCHGPDAGQRQAELRLDVRQAVWGEVLLPGDPANSLLFQRITASDPDERMPPPESKRSLTTEEIGVIERWIRSGADWQEHWSFVVPAPISLAPSASAWARNPIDHFVRARQLAEGLEPAPPADRTTLVRRVTLDLTGIPPTLAEVDAFLADASPNAYEKLVDRLLASPRYGERLASLWLDAARYADTSGYQNDGPREMWRWRDWVIDAYNSGMPFDQFTIEQLAGDLLPKPSLAQRIATGFNRNHRGNSEGGIIPEEYQVEYVVDRVETTSTVWLGLTMGCARCHDHKFDPLSQREFYQFYAFFNNIAEHGRAIKEGNSPPLIQAPTAAQQRELDDLRTQLAAAESAFTAELRRSKIVPREFPDDDSRPTVPDKLLARFSLDHLAADAVDETGGERLQWRGGEGKFVAGQRGPAAEFDGTQWLDAGDTANLGYFDRFTLMAWLRPTSRDGTVLSRMTDEPQGDGYSIQLVNGQVQINLVKRWLDDAIRVRSTAGVPLDSWSHLAVTYDGSRVASGIRAYLDGRPLELITDLDALNQSFAAGGEPLRIGAGGGPAGRFTGLLDDVRVYGEALTEDEVAIAAIAESPSEIAALNPVERTGHQEAKLQRHFLEHIAAGPLRDKYRRRQQLRSELAERVRNLPTVMIMSERDAPRETFVLLRGQYDQPDERVDTAVPSRLPPLTATGSRANRLDLAHWLFAPANPLTARVAVNRHWQIFFGRGLVETTEDFGIQGARPSHPELLDWLAVDFREQGWSVKGLHRQLVGSSTYRQSSHISPAALQHDPENLWLARGPRQRLSAEIVRDQALAASGLLFERLGGPSVRPYQPADLWQDIATDTDYEQSVGGDLYRRSLYTYWKRTISPPSMATFDASTRDTCRVRTAKTNTPLQALTLLNDVTFVEAARVLAEQVIADGSPTSQRLEQLFRRVLTRRPTPEELEILHAGLTSHLENYRRDPAAADELLGFGDHRSAAAPSRAEVAAYAAIAGLVLNLDEAVTNQ